MNIVEIKKKSSELFTDYLNYIIEKICNENGNQTNADDFFPLDVFVNTSRFSDTLKEHSQDMVDLFLQSKNKIGVGYSLEMESIVTRSSGRKSIIKKVFFAEENDYLNYINVKTRVDNLKLALGILAQSGMMDSASLKAWAKKHIRDLTFDQGDNNFFWTSVSQCVICFKTKNMNFPPQIPTGFLETNKNIIQSLVTQSESAPQNPKVDFKESDFDLPTEVSATKKQSKKNTTNKKNNDEEFDIPDFIPQKIDESASVEPKSNFVEKSIVEEKPKLAEKKEPQTIIESVDDNATTLKSKPFFVRFRSLSKTSPLKLGRLIPKEISLPLDDFINLNQTNFLKNISTVLIVNDETVFQNFPESDGVLCIFVPDFGVNGLKLCQWFGGVQLIYFGDISEHSFDVLSAFRNSWKKTESLCMDGNTWEKFFNSADRGGHLKNNAVPKNLSEKEKNTFLSLRLSPDKSRLQQNKIPTDYMGQYLDAIKVVEEEVE